MVDPRCLDCTEQTCTCFREAGWRRPWPWMAAAFVIVAICYALGDWLAR